MGIFLPLTIYLQSVLGFSALKAGLALAPASVVSMFVAPLTGRLTDRIGGKYILITGLSLFGIGMGWIALSAQTDSAALDFLAPLIVSGFGMGCIFAPLSTLAMRDVKPEVAGAASGMLNTTRQVGAVIGTAAVGALLQNRLAAGWNSQALLRTKTLSPPLRAAVVSGFRHAASTGAGPGAGRAFRPRPGLPTAAARQVEAVYHAVFTHGFVYALRPTMLMPIAVLAVAALSCLAIRARKPTVVPSAVEEAKTPTRA
jgi:MFS family permease